MERDGNNRLQIKLDDDLNIKKDRHIINQKSDVEYYPTLDLQKGSAGVIP